MADNHDRGVKILLWAMIAAMALVFAINKAKGQVIATFHPQFSERHTTSWDMCATNRGTANVSVGMADIYRITAGRMNVLNQSSRAYEMRMRPRNRWLRGLQIVATAATLLQATPALDIGDSWQYVFPLVAGGLQIAAPSIEANRRENFELGNYWDSPRTLAAGESQCAMVMSLKVKDPRSFVAIISSEIPMDPQGAMIPGPAVDDSFLRPEWLGSARPLATSPVSISLAEAPACIIRPSSVADEGCGAWYG